MSSNPLLRELLTYRRPHGSRTERRFLRTFLQPTGAQPDAFGNYHLTIGDAPLVLWSCHTDTVHWMGGRQTLTEDMRGVITTQDTHSNCLGADDTAGLYLMLQLIARQIPGHYTFHRGEERGGLGSAWLTSKAPLLIPSSVRACIALDRRGDGDVITHQMSGRCCSDAFAQSLADGLGLAYRPCAHGIFTDSANYTDLIGECTNLSVGYDWEHTRREQLDTAHLERLLDALSALDASALTFERAPGDPDDPWPDWLYEPSDDKPHLPLTLLHDWPDYTLPAWRRDTTDPDAECPLCGCRAGSRMFPGGHFPSCSQSQEID